MIAIVATLGTDLAGARDRSHPHRARSPGAASPRTSGGHSGGLKPEGVAPHWAAVAVNAGRSPSSSARPGPPQARPHWRPHDCVPEEGARRYRRCIGGCTTAHGGALGPERPACRRHAGRRRGLAALRSAGRAPDHRRPDDVGLIADLADRIRDPRVATIAEMGGRRVDRDRAVRGQSRGAFARLNRAWLTEHGLFEEVDRAHLEQPRKSILAGGGQIFVALDKGVVLGVCATIVQDSDTIEFAKFAVAPGGARPWHRPAAHRRRAGLGPRSRRPQGNAAVVAQARRRAAPLRALGVHLRTAAGARALLERRRLHGDDAIDSPSHGHVSRSPARIALVGDRIRPWSHTRASRWPSAWPPMRRRPSSGRGCQRPR